MQVYSLVDYIPFVGLAINHDATRTPIVTKLIETAIMAAVAAGFATYIGVELLRQDVTSLKTSLDKLDSKIEKLDEKVERVRSDLYVPRGMSRTDGSH